MLLLPLGSSVSESLIFRALFTKTGNQKYRKVYSLVIWLPQFLCLFEGVCEQSAEECMEHEGLISKRLGKIS
jgi:hypothetical protein